MPILQNPRHEAFAQARAKGARLEDAYEDAGFTPGHGHSSRLALQPLVAERIAELRALNARMTDANPALTIAALLQLADFAPGVRRPRRGQGGAPGPAGCLPRPRAMGKGARTGS